MPQEAWRCIVAACLALGCGASTHDEAAAPNAGTTDHTAVEEPDPGPPNCNAQGCPVDDVPPSLTHCAHDTAGTFQCGDLTILLMIVTGAPSAEAVDLNLRRFSDQFAPLHPAIDRFTMHSGDERLPAVRVRATVNDSPVYASMVVAAEPGRTFLLTCGARENHGEQRCDELIGRLVHEVHSPRPPVP